MQDRRRANRTPRAQRWLEYALVLAGLLTVLAANLPPDLASRWNVEPRYALIALTVLLIFALVRYVRFVLLFAAAALAIGARVPEELAARFNLDADSVLAALVALLVLSLVNAVYERVFASRRPPGVERRRTDVLLGAIRNDDVQVVDRLLRDGTSANLRVGDDKTPLMIAAATGYGDVVRLLLRHGADVHARDMEGATPLSIARRNAHQHIAELLVQAGAME